ncbi:MAG: hypothetical protein Q9192_003370 [Flavoplaca navasiana]
MDQSANRAGQQTGSSESVSRKESWSEKLNKLTNNPFGRHRTSNINASSESLSSLPPRSCIPTPSFGSRTSFPLGGLGVDTTDNTDFSGTQRNNRRDSSTGSTRKYTRQLSGSTSSFFGSNSLGRLYPQKYLDRPATGVEKKANRIPTEESQSSQRLQADHHGPLPSQNISLDVVQPGNFDKTTGATAKRSRRSETSTSSTVKKSCRISDRLGQTSFFRQQFVRHSIAAVPLTKDGEPSVRIEERRLMAPINPPLPRSTTMDPLNGPSAHSTQYSSPRTPSFMRPTSSSAARRSTISNTYKSPPMPLTLASGQKTGDLSGFFMHRERKRAAHDAAMTLGSHRVSHESTPGFLPGNGPQIMARNGLCAVQERSMKFGIPEHWAMKNLPSPPSKVPDPTTSAEAEFNSSVPRNVAMSPQRYPYGPRYGSRTDLNAASTTHEVQPPIPPLPQQLILNGTFTGNGGQGSGLPRPVTCGSRIPRSISNATDLQLERGGSRTFGIQPSASEYHLPMNRNEELLPSITDNSSTERIATHVNFPPRKASLAAATRNAYANTARSAVVPCSTPPRMVAEVATAEKDNGNNEVDLTLIRGAQDLRFWAGRYTAVSDRVRNDAQISHEAAINAHNDEQRQRMVLQYLYEKCANDETRESLDAFVRAWAHGWTGGVAGGFLGMVPEPPKARTSVTEDKKKSGFMGKVFGRRKS